MRLVTSEQVASPSAIRHTYCAVSRLVPCSRARGSRCFDTKLYRSHNADLKHIKDPKQLWEHYVTLGQFEVGFSVLDSVLRLGCSRLHPPFLIGCGLDNASKLCVQCRDAPFSSRAKTKYSDAPLVQVDVCHLCSA